MTTICSRCGAEHADQLATRATASIDSRTIYVCADREMCDLTIGQAATDAARDRLEREQRGHEAPDVEWAGFVVHDPDGEILSDPDALARLVDPS